MEPICYIAESKKQTKGHVILIHDKLAKKREDKYIINLALALQYSGFAVTIITSYFNEKEYLENTEMVPDKVHMEYVARWFPHSICGFLKSIMSSLKAAWMAFVILSCPPKPKPFLFIVDNSLVMCMLKTFSNCKVFYLEHFRNFKIFDDCDTCSDSIPSLFDAKWIKYADEIILENECWSDIFKRVYPAVGRNPKILTPCVDIGLWHEPLIHIERIIPDLRSDNTLFLTAGKYRKSTNFMLAIEAFELLLESLKGQLIRDNVHLVIAGQCKSAEEIIFYNTLVEETKLKLCASHVTFLRQLPTVHHKTLLAEATVVIHSSESITFSDFIIAAMSMGKPIIATNRGIAPKLLEQRVSGVLVEPSPSLFAATLHKLIASPSLRTFLGEMSKKAFEAKYSFKCISKKLNNLLLKYAPDVDNTDTIQSESNKQM